MISSKKIKEIAGKEGKKIGKNSIRIIEAKLLEEVELLMKGAARRADFSGRSTINEEDLGRVGRKF